MGTVTIEGSTTPCTELPRGERRTVTVTDHIRNLVRIGAVVVVEGSLNAAPPAPADHTGTTLNDPSGDTPLPTGDFAPADELTETEQIADDEAQGDGPDDDGVPARNASSEVWRKFVAEKVPGVQYSDVEDKGRDELIAAWDRYQQQVAGGS
jgi:hypothetical protein